MELTARLEMGQARREACEREIAESGERARAYRQDVASLLALRRDQLDRIERKVRALEMERKAVTSAPGVMGPLAPLGAGVVSHRIPTWGGRAVTLHGSR